MTISEETAAKWRQFSAIDVTALREDLDRAGRGEPGVRYEKWPAKRWVGDWYALRLLSEDLDRLLAGEEPTRYETLPERFWAYMSWETKELAAALTALEGGGGMPPVPPHITATSSHAAVQPYLPTYTPVPGGVITSEYKIRVSQTTMWFIAASYGNENLRLLTIRNDVGNPSAVTLGTNVAGYNPPNQSAMTTIIPVGQEWVSDVDYTRSVFLGIQDTAVSELHVTVIKEVYA